MVRLTLLLFFFTSICATLYAQNYRLQQASVRFEIENAGLTVKGKFDSIPSIQLSMEPGKPGSIVLSGSLAAASINTGIGIRDKHLRKTDYFDTEKYPVITLQSTGINHSSHSTQGTFQLKIKQTTRTVTIPISLTEKGSLVEMKGNFSINRKDFSIGGNSLVLGDMVTIFVQAVFIQER